MFRYIIEFMWGCSRGLGLDRRNPIDMRVPSIPTFIEPVFSYLVDWYHVTHRFFGLTSSAIGILPLGKDLTIGIGQLCEFIGTKYSFVGACIDKVSEYPVFSLITVLRASQLLSGTYKNNYVSFKERDKLSQFGRACDLALRTFTLFDPARYLTSYIVLNTLVIGSLCSMMNRDDGIGTSILDNAFYGYGYNLGRNIKCRG